MDTIRHSAELIAAVKSSIATSSNPFSSSRPDTRALTINALIDLANTVSAAVIIEVLEMEVARLADYTMERGGMLAYEMSLPYREALFNAKAALTFFKGADY